MPGLGQLSMPPMGQLQMPSLGQFSMPGMPGAAPTAPPRQAQVKQAQAAQAASAARMSATTTTSSELAEQEFFVPLRHIGKVKLRPNELPRFLVLRAGKIGSVGETNPGINNTKSSR